MADLSRRQFIATASAASVAASLPIASAPGIAAKGPAAPLPTWIVGTPGEWDHQVIRAATRELAVRFRCEECDYEDDPEANPAEGEGGPDCECEACSSGRFYEATRVEKFDGKPLDKITSGDWIDAEFCAACDRCGEETDFDCGGQSVDGKAVCEDCLTLADWDKIDPVIAAEKRAELEDAA